MSKNRDYRDRLERVLIDHGITAFRYVTKRNCHIALEFEYRGRPMKQTIPGTPSDCWGPRRAASDLRRMLRGAAE